MIALFVSCPVVSIFASRYYRLLEPERRIFLGFKGIDSLAAAEYINLESATERGQYYEDYWNSRSVEEKQQFEERIEYAYRQYGRFAPLSDERIQIYVKYGTPSKREEIIPQKKIALRTNEAVNPAEIWRYNKEGLLFDFVRIARAYKLFAQSEFGDRVVIAILGEINLDTVITEAPIGVLDVEIATGKFRQKKNLTRLEVYSTVHLEDTTGVLLKRTVAIYDMNDSMVNQKLNYLVPMNADKGLFYDEINLWLVPDEYRLEVVYYDYKNNLFAKQVFFENLIEYQDDAKEISDLIPARLIDHSFTHEKFNKAVGRVIPLLHSALPVHQPFYFYAEVYNLETENGYHQLHTSYEVYNKEKMRQEIVDVMIKDYIDVGNIAFLGSEYHPMDLDAGHYMIVLHAKDLISGKERTAVAEFELIKP